MKILKLILFTALISLTISCSSDDDGAALNSGSIVGVWRGTAVNYSGTSTTSGQGQSFTSEFVGEAYDIDYTLTFSENPNKVVSEGNYSIELTTTYMGQTITQNIEGLSFLSDGNWSLNGTTLSITMDNDTQDATIVELTPTKMVIEATQTTTVDQGGGTTNTSTTNIVMSFDKA